VWTESCFALAWRPYGAGSLTITWSDVLELDVPLRNDLLRRVAEQRRAEASALRRRA